MTLQELEWEYEAERNENIMIYLSSSALTVTCTKPSAMNLYPPGGLTRGGLR